jgi:hypothetical protein
VEHRLLSESETLCASCGLCCDGTLFSWVRLEPSELAWAERLRLPLIDKGESKAFLQPCACFDGSRCRAYAEKPMRCGNYRCKLLKRVEAGETTLADALVIVATTKALARVTYPNGRPAGAPPGSADGALWQAEAGELEARLDRDFEEE